MFILQKGHDGLKGKQKDSCTFSLTSAVDRGEWLKPRPDRPGNNLVPIVQGAGWVAGPVFGQVQKISLPLRFIPRNVRPLTSRYIDLGISVPVPDHRNFRKQYARKLTLQHPTITNVNRALFSL